MISYSFSVSRSVSVPASMVSPSAPFDREFSGCGCSDQALCEAAEWLGAAGVGDGTACNARTQPRQLRWNAVFGGARREGYDVLALSDDGAVLAHSRHRHYYLVRADNDSWGADGTGEARA